MRRLAALVVAFSVLAAFSSAGAQSPPPAASAPAPAVTPAERAPAPPLRANRDTASAADPRRCLEFSTNPEIIKCAEKYLQRRRNG
jgi:hypothetical protein